MATSSASASAIAGWTDNGGDDVPSQLTFLTPENYSNYAMFDTCKPCILINVCSDATSVWGAPLGSTSVRLSWDTIPHPSQQEEHQRYLIRYWVLGEDYVELATVDSGSTEMLDLTGLEPNTQYGFQVLAGCTNLPSKHWSPVGVVTTLP